MCIKGRISLAMLAIDLHSEAQLSAFVGVPYVNQ